MKAAWATVPRNGAPSIVLLDEHNKLIAEYELTPKNLAVLVSRGAEWLANHLPESKATYAPKVAGETASDNDRSGIRREVASGHDGL